MGMGAFDLVTRFGTRIVEVPDLERPLIYLPDYDIALVRTGLDGPRAERAADWLLTQALRQRSAS